MTSDSFLPSLSKPSCFSRFKILRRVLNSFISFYPSPKSLPCFRLISIFRALHCSQSNNLPFPSYTYSCFTLSPIQPGFFPTFSDPLFLLTVRLFFFADVLVLFHFLAVPSSALQPQLVRYIFFQ